MVNSGHAVGQTQSPSTRKSKRPAPESPKLITIKKPRTGSDDAVISATNDEDSSSDVQPKIDNKEDKFKEKVEAETDESLVEMSDETQKSEDTELKTLKGKSGKPVVTDVISPRRSSRAVVPNSRFKDMVDFGKKKAGRCF